MEERLQKILSAAGVCSRRAAEGYITSGRVTINGRQATLGEKADPEQDDICVDGKPVCRENAPVYLMLNKPRGFVTTLSDEQGRRTVADLTADCGARVWPVGRLDLDSEGLLLMTNDGEITNILIHPRHEVEKEYVVLVEGDVEHALPILEGPMELEGVSLRPAQVKVLGPQKLSVIIHEGKNRQVRRMCEHAGLRVYRLRRIREGSLTLGALATGRWRSLTKDEIKWLKTLV